eukprot:TRINITY_DN37220_c0_g1_i1.p1 TRINITY_DN37220_c0_g1~~TRINITY_DN37220_c0_g1_i1.p1  ORF type:complete len:354 (-),score=54.81 TRINITY_DN37220_c0_g1_i1:349-1410(-)
MMRAAVYHEFGGPIRIEDIPLPKIPNDGVVVKVKATGVCRSDWHGWKGHDSDIVDHGLPFVPGHELSGIVYEVGPDVKRFTVGDRVAVPFILSCGSCAECCRGKPTICEAQHQPGFTMLGSFAQFVALPRADRNLSLLPIRISFVAAAALGCRTTTAWRAIVKQGRLQPSDTVAIFGCGGVGLSCIMIAVALGARVVAVDTSAGAREKALSLGAFAAVDPSSFDNDEDVRNAVRGHTGGTGADLSVDAAGFRSTCEHAVWCARRGGRVVQVGLPLGSESPSIPMARVAGWELEILGSHGCDAADFPDILAMVEKGTLQPEKLVEKEITLAEGAKAIMDMDGGSPLGMLIVTDF